MCKHHQEIYYLCMKKIIFLLFSFTALVVQAQTPDEALRTA